MGGFFRKPDGTTVEVPDEQVGAAVDAGFQPISHGEHLTSLEENAARPEGEGLIGGINAAATSFLSGATLGGSDIVLGALMTPGEKERLRQHREAHNVVSGIANVAGAVAPTLLSGGGTAPESIASYAPSAIVSRGAERIAAGGAEAGLATRAAAAASGAAYEGGAQMAGAYLSDVALGNRDLSAEGFVASVKTGALLGGAVGGGGTLLGAGLSKAAGAAKKYVQRAQGEAVTAAEDAFGSGTKMLDMGADDAAAGAGLQIEEQAGKGWTPARRLFPAHEADAAGVKVAESEFHTGLDQLGQDVETIEQAGRQKLEELRLQKMQSDTATRDHLNKLRIEQAEQRVAAQREVAATRAAQRESAELRLAKQKAGPQPKAPKGEPLPENGTAPAEGTGAVEDPTLPSSGEPVNTEAPTDLEQQLAATKQKLDEGTPLGTLSGSDRGLEHVADARVMAQTEDGIHKRIDDYIAGGDAEFARVRDATENLSDAKAGLDAWLGKYGKRGQVGRFESSEASRAYAEGMRSKGPGWVTAVPEGEGNVIVRRGRQMEWRGTDAQRAEAEAAIDAKRFAQRDHRRELFPEANLPTAGEEQAAVEARLGRSSSERDHVLGAVQEAAAGRAIEGVAPADLMRRAGENTDDIAEAIQVIGTYERAVHDAMDAIKPSIPVPAAEKSAAGTAEAIQRQEAAHVEHATQAAEHSAEALATPEGRRAVDIARGPEPLPEPHWQDAMLPGGVPATASPAAAVKGGSSMIERAKEIGTVLEVLHSMGVQGVPDPSSIPVVGPILGMYLKARALATIHRRLGGKVPTTVETKIASAAATTRTRALQTVERVIDAGGAVARGAKTASVPTATQILSRKLLADRDDHEDEVSDRKSSPVARRVAELADFMTNRDSYLASIKRSLPTRDPAVANAVASVVDRKMSYLDGLAPKDPRPPSLVKTPWVTPPGKVESFARAVRAVEDPMSVLEDLENGRCTPEAADAVRVCYPNIFGECQRALVTKAPELLDKLGYAQRQNLSALFRVPLDATQTPEYQSWISTPSGAGSASGTSQPGPQPAPGTPPQPGIVADVSLSRSVDPYTGRRAMR
jgi:hypothetical protein